MIRRATKTKKASQTPRRYSVKKKPEAEPSSLFVEMKAAALPPETGWTKLLFWCSARRQVFVVLAVLILAGGTVGAFGWHYGLAQVWSGPSSGPPNPNAPGVIWNKISSPGSVQPGSAFYISDGGTIGKDLSVLGRATVLGDATVKGNLNVTGSTNLDSNTLIIDTVNNRVGIVQPSPKYPLDVNGAVNASQLCLPTGGAPSCIASWSAVTGVTPSLQAVTDVGNVTTKDIITGKIGAGGYGIDATVPTPYAISAPSAVFGVAPNGTTITGGNVVTDNSLTVNGGASSLVLVNSASTLKVGNGATSSVLTVKHPTSGKVVDFDVSGKVTGRNGLCLYESGASVCKTAWNQIGVTGNFVHLQTSPITPDTGSASITGSLALGATADPTNVKPKVIYYQTATTGVDLYARHLGKDPATGRWSIEDILTGGRNFTWGVYPNTTATNPPTLQSQITRVMTLTDSGALSVTGDIGAANIVGRDFNAWNLLLREQVPEIRLGFGTGDTSDRTLKLVHKDGKKAHLSVSGGITANDTSVFNGMKTLVGTVTDTSLAEFGTATSSAGVTLPVAGHFVHKFISGTTQTITNEAWLGMSLADAGGVAGVFSDTATGNKVYLASAASAADFYGKVNFSKTSGGVGVADFNVPVYIDSTLGLGYSSPINQEPVITVPENLNIQLDNDNNSTKAEFRVKNGTGGIPFLLDEAGNLSISGNLTTGGGSGGASQTVGNITMVGTNPTAQPYATIFLGNSATSTNPQTLYIQHNGYATDSSKKANLLVRGDTTVTGTLATAGNLLVADDLIIGSTSKTITVGTSTTAASQKLTIQHPGYSGSFGSGEGPVKAADLVVNGSVVAQGTCFGSTCDGEISTRVILADRGNSTAATFYGNVTMSKMLSVGGLITNADAVVNGVIKGYNGALINGNIIASGHIFAHTASHIGDVAEPLAIVKSARVGDIIIVDNGQYVSSAKAYDARVIGVYSENPSLVLANMENRKPLAVSGFVKVNATTENGQIKSGDLLVSSATPGHAMRCEAKEKCQGAVIGKALESLEKGTGKVLMIVTLQ